jgi:hypothetical protein
MASRAAICWLDLYRTSEGAIVLPIANPIGCLERNDAIDPPAKAGGVMQPINPSYDGQPRCLRHIGGCFSICSESHRVAHDSWLPPRDQFGKRSGVSLLAPQY